MNSGLFIFIKKLKLFIKKIGFLVKIYRNNLISSNYRF